MTGLLLDTCAVIWIAQSARLKPSALARIEESLAENAAHVSPFTAWEMSLLASRGRLNLTSAVDDWFEEFLDSQGFALAQLPVAVLVAAHQLPGAPPGDPADRILIATARQFGFAIVTRDRRILNYGAAGLVQTVTC